MKIVKPGDEHEVPRGILGGSESLVPGKFVAIKN